MGLSGLGQDPRPVCSRVTSLTCLCEGGSVLLWFDKWWHHLGHLPICMVGSIMNQQCERAYKGMCDKARTSSEEGINLGRDVRHCLHPRVAPSRPADLYHLLGRNVRCCLHPGDASSRPATMYPMLTKLTYFGPQHFSPTQDSETLHGLSFGHYKMVPENKKIIFPLSGLTVSKSEFLSHF